MKKMNCISQHLHIDIPNNILFLLVLVLLGSQYCNGLTSGETQALTDMKTAWTPAGWTNSPSCSWPGLTCVANSVQEMKEPEHLEDTPILSILFITITL